MANPVFGSRSLQDSSYYTTDVQFRTTAPREINLVKISRRPGAKRISDEYREKRITLKGYAVGSSASDLQSKVDNLQKDLHLEDQTLTIEDGRSYIATLASLVIPDIHYNQTLVPFEVEFICAEPFAQGSSTTDMWVVPSGTFESDRTINVAGTVFAEPTVYYYSPSGTSDTGVYAVTVRNVQTGEMVTYSGGGTDRYLDRGKTLTFNYKTYEVALDGTTKDHTGKFSRFEPGNNQIITSFSGGACGGLMKFTYVPRYY